MKTLLLAGLLALTAPGYASLDDLLTQCAGPDGHAALGAWQRIEASLPHTFEVPDAPTRSAVQTVTTDWILGEIEKLHASVTDATPPQTAADIYHVMNGHYQTLQRTIRPHAYLFFLIEQRLAEVKLRQNGGKLERPGSVDPLPRYDLSAAPPEVLHRAPQIMPTLLQALDTGLASELPKLTEKQRLLLLQGMVHSGMQGVPTRISDKLHAILVGHDQMSRFYGAMQARALEALNRIGGNTAYAIIASSLYHCIGYPTEVRALDGSEIFTSAEWIQVWYSQVPSPEKRDAIVAVFRSPRPVRNADGLRSLVKP